MVKRNLEVKISGKVLNDFKIANLNIAQVTSYWFVLEKVYWRHRALFDCCDAIIVCFFSINAIFFWSNEYVFQMFELYHEQTLRQRWPQAQCCANGVENHTALDRGLTPATRRAEVSAEPASFQQRRRPYQRPLVHLEMKRKVDAEVGKAHHMRVARRRHDCSRRYPASVSTTPHTFPLPLTHPQPC